MEPSTISFKQAQSLFPDEWVLVGNPILEGTTVKDGMVLFHSKDKKEVCYLGREKSEGYARVAVVFTGAALKSRRIGILRRL